jgi:hypothetical protein
MADILEGELLGADVEIDAKAPDAVEPTDDEPQITSTSLGAIGGLALGGLFASGKADEGATASEKLARGAVGAIFGALAGATLGALVDALTGTPNAPAQSADTSSTESPKPAELTEPTGTPSAEHTDA